MSISTPSNFSFATGATSGAAKSLLMNSDMPIGALIVGAVAIFDTVSLTSVTDGPGNTYTLGTPKSDAAGHTLVPFWSENITHAITASPSLTAHFSADATSVHVVAMGVATGAGLNDISAAGATGTSTTPASPFTGTLAKADEVAFGFLLIEAGSSSVRTEASGFTSGSLTGLSTQARLGMAWEIVAATTSIAYNPTLSVSRQWVANIATFKGNDAYSPGAGSLTLTGQMPALAYTYTPGAASLALTGQTPTFASNSTFTPGAAALSLTGYAPQATGPSTYTPGVGSLALTGLTPAMIQGYSYSPGAGALVLTGLTLSLVEAVTFLPGAASLTLTGLLPASISNSLFTPGSTSLLLSGKTPSIGSAAVLQPGPAVLTLTGYPPLSLLGVVGKSSAQQIGFDGQSAEQTFGWTGKTSADGLTFIGKSSAN